EADFLAFFGEALDVRYRRGLPCEFRDDSLAVAELAPPRVKAAVRDHSSKAGDDFEHGIRAIEHETPIVVLHMDVVRHQASERFEVLRVVSRDPPIRDVYWISRWLSPLSAFEQLP